jgi:hypothetical protein
MKKIKIMGTILAIIVLGLMAYSSTWVVVVAPERGIYRVNKITGTCRLDHSLAPYYVK